MHSQKGTYYVLCAPNIVHADPEVMEKYCTWVIMSQLLQIVSLVWCVVSVYAATQKLFHEAGFDAFCAGFSE